MTLVEFEKSNFLAELNRLKGGLTGLFMRGFIGVLTLVESSSSETERVSFDTAFTCVAFFGLNGEVS